MLAGRIRLDGVGGWCCTFAGMSCSGCQRTSILQQVVTLTGALSGMKRSPIHSTSRALISLCCDDDSMIAQHHCHQQRYSVGKEYSCLPSTSMACICLLYFALTTSAVCLKGQHMIQSASWYIARYTTLVANISVVEAVEKNLPHGVSC